MEATYINTVEYLLISPITTAKHTLNSSYLSEDLRQTYFNGIPLWVPIQQFWTSCWDLIKLYSDIMQNAIRKLWFPNFLSLISLARWLCESLNETNPGVGVRF
jgi:hypothetical protein